MRTQSPVLERELEPTIDGALEAAMRALTHNLVSYAESFLAATQKDREIKRVTDSLADAQEDVAEQIEAVLDKKRRHVQLGNYPESWTRFNYMSYTSALPKVLEDLAERHRALRESRNALLGTIQRAQDAAALMTAAKTLCEKAIEKLNAQAKGVCDPVSVPADPPELKPLVPRVKIVEVVETVGVAGVAAAAAVTAAPAAHDEEEEAEEHEAAAHEAPHAEEAAHAPAAHAAPAPAAKPVPSKAEGPEPAPAAKVEAKHVPSKAEGAAPEPRAAEPEKKAEDDEAGFVPTWDVKPLERLDAGKSNFLLASETDSADLLTKLARDANHLARHNVALNPNTPKAVLEGLKGDPSVYVRRAARTRLGG